MEDVRVGLVVRAVRLRRKLRQRDLARMAGVSQQLVSQIERGDLDSSPLKTVRMVSGALGISMSLLPRYRGVELDRLLDERHALMVRQVTMILRELGWEVRPETSFAIGRESGSVDVFAWFVATRTVLVIEVKSVVPDIQQMLSTLDRKRRLAVPMARQLGWQPQLVGAVLVLSEGGQARKALTRFAPILDAALPSRTVAVRQWLVRPDRDLRGIWFLPNTGPCGMKREVGGQIRLGTGQDGHSARRRA